MSDNIPFDIQMQIIKKVYDVKSLIQFRSVSKPWKSFIDSPQFIKGYGARHTQPHSRILSYISDGFLEEAKYIRLVEDDNSETFKVQQQESAPFVLSPLLNQYFITSVVGACHVLLCFYGLHNGSKEWKVVIWNPSIGKSFGIAIPEYVPQTPTQIFYGFGVCPVNLDPTVVKIVCADNMPWYVEVFTLSSGIWNVIPGGNLPRQSVRLNKSTQVVIDRFIYWAAYEENLIDDGVPHYKYMVVSFDLITKEFKVVDLPDTLTNELLTFVPMSMSISKLRGSLVVCGYIKAEKALCYGVWVMEHDSSFRKLFSIGAPVNKILGFRKNGEPIFETIKEVGVSTLYVYDPPSQQIKDLGISGVDCSFFMGSYKESLLLLDHPDLHIYSNDHNDVGHLSRCGLTK